MPNRATAAKQRLFLGLFLAALCLAAGCDSRPKRVPVSGTVLIDGQPLAFGTVVFVPDGGRQSTGTLDSSGHFQLSCFDPNDGALLGEHKVQVLSSEFINNTTNKWHAPKKYADRRTSGLTEKIPGSRDDIVINLTWKGSTPDKPFVERIEANAGEEAFGKSRKR